MKLKLIAFMLTTALIMSAFCSCAHSTNSPQVVATTLPVYEFTKWICEGTDIGISQLITENVSCLHNYTLQVQQMRAIESAQLVVISGAGLEDFLDNALNSAMIIDASANVQRLCGSHYHNKHDDHSIHTHEEDPHIWLSPVNAKIMAQNICTELSEKYPEHSNIFTENLQTLLQKLDELYNYGYQELSKLSCREIITFHDGFSYFAEAFGLNILHAVEEESGSEASAAELIELLEMISEHQLPAVFTEENGSTAAASIIAAESGIKVYTLNMAMSGDSYFDAMYQNIKTVKEALG